MTIGTPVRPDFVINRNTVERFCAISISNDFVQLNGASVIQVAGYYTALEAAFHEEFLAMLAYDRGDVEGFWYHSELAAGWYIVAAGIELSTRLNLSADINVVRIEGPILSKESHTRVREVGTWNAATSQSKWVCR